MSLVKSVVTASKVASATYRIAATAVMGYYLVKGVVDHERTKNNANNYPPTIKRSSRPRSNR